MHRYLDAFAAFRQINMGHAKGTAAAYVSFVREFIGFLEQRGLSTTPDDIQRSDIDDYVQALFLQKRSNAPGTLATKLSGLRAFFRFLVYKRVIEYDPTEGVPTPKRPYRVPQVFTTQQLRKILAVPDPNTVKGLRDLAMLMTIYGAGLRKKEVPLLTTSSVEDVGRGVYLYVFGKGAKERVLMLRRRPATILRLWMARRQELEPGNDSSALDGPPPGAGARQ